MSVLIKSNGTIEVKSGLWHGIAIPATQYHQCGWMVVIMFDGALSVYDFVPSRFTQQTLIDAMTGFIRKQEEKGDDRQEKRQEL